LYNVIAVCWALSEIGLDTNRQHSNRFGYRVVFASMNVNGTQLSHLVAADGSAYCMEYFFCCRICTKCATRQCRSRWKVL